MKILLYSINYAPEVTGIGKYNGEMCEWLAGHGHDIRVVTAPPYYPAWRVAEGYSARSYRRERVAGVDIWRCPVWVPARPSGIKRLLHLASFAASSIPATLRQILWHPDVVMVTEPPLFCVPQARLVARLSGAKTWLHILDYEIDAALDLGLLKRWDGVRRLLYRIEYLLMRGLDRVSTISEQMRQRIVKKGINEKYTRLFPNWAETEFVVPLPQDNEVRREFRAGASDLLVMHAGNMGEKQGLDLVLEAAEHLKKRTEIRFVMVGAGTSRKRLERLSRERGLHNVRFAPVQPLKRLPLMLAAADVHLVVQRREAADLVMPSRLTNILSAGRPSIATADPDTALYEVVDGHNCGIVTTPGSAEELAESIIALAEDAKLREHLGENARRYAESYLDKDKILSEFEDELRKLAD